MILEAIHLSQRMSEPKDGRQKWQTGPHRAAGSAGEASAERRHRGAGRPGLY